jgi:hypothetical protein
MSMATRKNTQLPTLHDADSHDLIRVLGARENNLKDVTRPSGQPSSTVSESSDGVP